MVAEVKNNLDKIIDACKQMQVKSFYLVGSGAIETDFTPESDLDFLYTTLPPTEADSPGGLDFLIFCGNLKKSPARKRI